METKEASAQQNVEEAMACDAKKITGSNSKWPQFVGIEKLHTWVFSTESAIYLYNIAWTFVFLFTLIAFFVHAFDAKWNTLITHIDSKKNVNGIYVVQV